MSLVGHSRTKTTYSYAAYEYVVQVWCAIITQKRRKKLKNTGSTKWLLGGRWIQDSCVQAKKPHKQKHAPRRRDRDPRFRSVFPKKRYTMEGINCVWVCLLRVFLPTSWLLLGLKNQPSTRLLASANHSVSIRKIFSLLLLFIFLFLLHCCYG